VKTEPAHVELPPMLDDTAADSQVPGASVLPEHLARLSDSPWAVWRWAGLRGAGFPAALVLKLAAPECAGIADQLSKSEEDTQRARGEALAAVQAERDRFRDEQAGNNSERLAPLSRALGALKTGKLPKPLDDAYTSAESIEVFRATQLRSNTLQEEFNRTFETERAQISAAIREIAQMQRFREAVLWQNRQAVHNAIDLIANKSSDVLRSSDRQKEELIAQYIQRYCVKNDTIGFFGPVGWARFVDTPEPLIMRPGATLLHKRTVYFEQWCIDALADALAQNSSLRPWFLPCRIASLFIEGTTLYRPFEQPIQVFPTLAALLQLCDGSRTAKDIAAKLVQCPDIDLNSEEEVYELLELLQRRELILWTFAVPPVLFPEDILRQQLMRIDEASLREPALHALDELECARAEITRAAGNAEHVDQALDNLEAAFLRSTGANPTRFAGQAYAGRTLIYEDCQRDVDLRIGQPMLDVLAPPLALLLASARWITFETAARYRQLLGEIYDVLVQQTGSPSVALPSFWSRAQVVLLAEADTHPLPLVSLLSDFQKRWADILDIPTGQSQVAYTSKELWPQVASAFQAPAPGWQVARYHSADVMIAASSAEAIQRGGYQLVLGELHVGVNTLKTSYFLAQHPDPQGFFQAVNRDFSAPRVVPIAPRDWRGITSRTRDVLVADKDFRLAFTAQDCGMPDAQVLPIGDLVVEQQPEGLIVQTRDSRLKVDVVEFCAEALSLLVVHLFKILRPDAHTPRVTLDELIICRETWRIPANTIPFIATKSKSSSFLEARRWARAQNMPRFVFVKIPVEPKPLFIDFDSPVLINILARAIRRDIEHNQEESVITIAEMLPTPDQTWLADEKGQHYTCELRIVAIDRCN